MWGLKNRCAGLTSCINEYKNLPLRSSKNIKLIKSGQKNPFVFA